MFHLRAFASRDPNLFVVVSIEPSLLDNISVRILLSRRQQKAHGPNRTYLETLPRPPRNISKVIGVEKGEINEVRRREKNKNQRNEHSRGSNGYYPVSASVLLVKEKLRKIQEKEDVNNVPQRLQRKKR